MTELYHKYRPRTLDEVVGQSPAVKVLQSMIEGGNVPHAILFTGASGVGKTTMARILARELGCERDISLMEVNCAVCDPMNTVRSIQEMVQVRPIICVNSPACWIMDEFQALSRAGFAQQALLKILEDCPEWLYFLLASTDPGKILPTIRNRCTEIPLKSVPPDALEKLCLDVCAKEDFSPDAKVLSKVVEGADGSPRRMLVILEKVIAASPNKEDMLRMAEDSDSEISGFELVKSLLPYKGVPNWKEVSSVLRRIEDEDAESIRRRVMAFARSVLLKGGPQSEKAAVVMKIFRFPFYDNGRNDLALACYELCRAYSVRK